MTDPYETKKPISAAQRESKFRLRMGGLALLISIMVTWFLCKKTGIEIFERHWIITGILVTAILLTVTVKLLNKYCGKY